MTYSNIPTMSSYGIYLSQLIRVCRICTEYSDFCTAVLKITKEFLNKGFDKVILSRFFRKFITNYELEWSKFGVELEMPTYLCT